MSEKYDIYFRAHTVVIGKSESKKENKSARPKNIPKWPEYALAFDCETRTDTRQEFIFGFYRILKLRGDFFELIVEGGIFDDCLPKNELEILQEYFTNEIPDVASFPPEFPLLSRSTFVKDVFYKLARKGALIVGFNLPFDLSRLARKWPEGERDEWSLVLSEYPDGNENRHNPRVLIDPMDSKKAFIRFVPEWVPEDGKSSPTNINNARFLDLRTTLWALFNKSLSLKSACALKSFAKYNLPQKIDHIPTGRVTREEIEYARQDVRCTVTCPPEIRPA